MVGSWYCVAYKTMDQKAEDEAEGPNVLCVNRHNLGATGSFPKVIHVGGIG